MTAVEDRCSFVRMTKYGHGKRKADPSEATWRVWSVRVDLFEWEGEEFLERLRVQESKGVTSAYFVL